MRKELGKWLMDIAKYLVTAVLLSSIITDMGNSWILYLSVSFSVVVTLSVGLWLVRDKKERIMSALVSVIAIVGGVYFWIQDKKETRKDM